MQASSIMSIPTAAGPETAAELPASGMAAPGKGMHVNSARLTKSNRSLFNKILHQGMTPRERASVPDGYERGAGKTGGGAPAEDLSKDDKAGETVTNISLDVCALLVQLNVLGAAAGTAAELNAEAVAGTAALAAVGAADQEAAAAVPDLAGIMTAGGGQEIPAAGDTTPQTGDVGTVPGTDVSQIIREIANAMNSQEQAAVTTTAPADGGETPEALPVVPAGEDDGIQNAAADGGKTAVVSGIAAQTADDRQADEPGVNAATRTGAVNTAPADQLTGAAPGSGEARASSGGDQTADRQRRDDMTLESGNAARMTAGGPAARDPAAETAPAADKAAAVEKAFVQLSDDVRGLRAGSREINIVLEPKSLGVLTISVIKTEHGISATIKSEDRELCAVMSDRLHNLIASMETKGISVRDVDVVYNQDRQSADTSQQAFSQQREQTSGGGGAPREKRHDGSPAAPLPEDGGGDETGDATVEYRV